MVSQSKVPTQPHRRFFFTPSPDWSSPATQHATADAIQFSRELGFKPVVAKRKIHEYYAKLAGAWIRSDVFLSMYPTFGAPLHEANRLRKLDSHCLRTLRSIFRNVKSILYIDDLPIEQNLAVKNPVDNEAYLIEERLLSCFDVLLVFNKEVQDVIQNRYGIDSEKFVAFEIQDYAVNLEPPTDRSDKQDAWTVVYTGNCDTRHVGWWFKDLPRSPKLRYEFFGPNRNWTTDRPDIIYNGIVDTVEHLAEYISKRAHFGFFASSPEYKHYYDYTSTSKFGAYITAGLPVLVPSEYNYVASLVVKYGVGFVLDSYNDVAKVIEELSWSDYMAVRERCLVLGEKLRSGHFFKKSVNEALLKLGMN